MEDGGGCGAGGGYAARSPSRVGFGEEAGDLAPAGSFAGLARFADQDDEEIESVTSGAHAAVRSRTGEVAEGSQELKENGGGIGFCVRGKTANGEAGQTVECGAGQCSWWGRGGPGWKDHRWLRLFFGVGFLEFVVFLRLFLLLRKREPPPGRESLLRGVWRVLARPPGGPGKQAALYAVVLWRRVSAACGKG